MVDRLKEMGRSVLLPPQWVLALLPQFRAMAYRKMSVKHAPELDHCLPTLAFSLCGCHRGEHGRVQVAKKAFLDSRQSFFRLLQVAHVLKADFPQRMEDLETRAGCKVLPYQKEAVDFACQRGGRVLLGDEMGLGKTAQALTLAAQFKKDFPLLVAPVLSVQKASKC